MTKLVTYPPRNSYLCLYDGWRVIHEDFIGLVEVESTSAATLFSVLKDCLVCLSLPMSFMWTSI